MVELYTRIALKSEFPFIVSIQKRDTKHHSYSVGVLIQSHLVMTTCNLFLDSLYTPPEEEVEEGRFKLFRLIASGTVLVENLQDENAVNAQVRFIENVHLHPMCNESNVDVDDLRVWRNDIAIVHLSFGFHLNLMEHKLGVINFKNESDDLTEKRLEKLTEYIKKRTVCAVVGWGRFVTIFSTGIFDPDSRDYFPSPDLLVSTVRLSPLSVCQKHCKKNPMLCNLSNSTNGHLVCAQRATKPFMNAGKNLSHFPCMGAEGSPLLCYAGQKFDFYGILNYLPKASCESKWPMVFTRVDDASKFALSIIGKGQDCRGNVYFILVKMILLFLVH